MRMYSGLLAVKTDEEILSESGLLCGTKKETEKNSLNQGIVKHKANDIQDIKIGDKVVFVEGTYWKNTKRINPDEFTDPASNEKLIRVPIKEIRMIIGQ